MNYLERIEAYRIPANAFYDSLRGWTTGNGIYYAFEGHRIDCPDRFKKSAIDCNSCAISVKDKER